MPLGITNGFAGGTIMFKRVLLCYDGSEVGRRALRRGAELSIILDAHVYVLAIVPTGLSDPAVIAAASGCACIANHRTVQYKTLLGESIEWLKARGVVAEGYLSDGDPIGQIVAHSKRLAIELIVLGDYPQRSGGFWWSGPRRVSLAERTQCCILVAVDGPK